MKIEVVHLPADLEDTTQLAERSVVVLDVLRATTTIVTALAGGAREIRVFDSLERAAEAAAAARARDPRVLLCGERDCLRPPGFDLGNSPPEFTAERVGGHTIVMSTTNGTRAILAATTAHELFVAALVNARATAGGLIRAGRDVTLLCAGTGGHFSLEDVLGAGALIDALLARGGVILSNDEASAAWCAYRGARDDLPSALHAGRGGKNVLAAGLERDVAAAAQVDAFDVVAVVERDPLRVVRA